MSLPIAPFLRRRGPGRQLPSSVQGEPTGGGSRSWEEVTVDLPAALAAALGELVLSSPDLDEDVQDELPISLSSLVEGLRTAVPSFQGLELVLADRGQAVVLTALAPDVDRARIATSLRLALSALDPLSLAQEASGLTFWAATPGALVDLAADLRFALFGPPVAGSVIDHRALRLDADLEPSTVESGLLGVSEVSTVHRAVGLLIGHGYHPDEAYDELVQRAAQADLSVLACAAALLGRASG